MDTRKIVFLLYFSAFASAALKCSNSLNQLCFVANQIIFANEEFEIIRTTSIPVTDLILSSTEFSKFPTTIFINHPDLMFLSISSSSLKVVSFKNFANALNLRRLYLSNGDLVMISNGTFRSCTSLEELQIYNHKISTVAVNAFQGLTNLKKLVLNNNSIESLDPTVLSMLPNLNFISMDMNKLKALSSDIFKLNPLLYFACFSNNLIRELPENLLSSQLDIDSIYFDQNLLSSARTFGASYVDLSNNKLEKLIIDSGTKVLHIKNNIIVSADCPGSNLTSFERVFASNNSLINLKCFRDMENLYDLDVSDNNLQRPSPEVFSKLSKIRDFRFFNQKFSKIPAKVFTSMKNIQIFRIDRFTDFRNLRQLFPNIAMVFLTTKTWNCSYTMHVSKVLARQKIRMSYNDFKDRQICNVTQVF